MTWFPVFENMHQKTFLLIGGGKVAAGKVERLKEYFAQSEEDSVCIRILAPETEIHVDEILDGNAEDIPAPAGNRRRPVRVQWLRREYRPGDETLGDLVIAATDSGELNTQIAQRCRRQQIPVNVIDNTALCTWLFPSLIRRGSLAVGISTGGTSPAYSQMLRKQIEKEIPDEIDRILERMGECRALLQTAVPEQKHRRAVLKQMLAELLSGESSPELPAEQLLDKYLDKTKLNSEIE